MDSEQIAHLVGWRVEANDVNVYLAKTACLNRNVVHRNVVHRNVVYGGLCVSLHPTCLALRTCFNPFLDVSCHHVPHKLLMH